MYFIFNSLQFIYYYDDVALYVMCINVRCERWESKIIKSSDK